MLPYFTLPVDEQPLAHMTRGYIDIAELDDLTDGDRRLIESRLSELERNREMAIALRDDAPGVTTSAPTPAPAPVAVGVPTGSLVDAGTPTPRTLAPRRIRHPHPTPTPAPTPIPAPAPTPSRRPRHPPRPRSRSARSVPATTPWACSPSAPCTPGTKPARAAASARPQRPAHHRLPRTQREPRHHDDDGPAGRHRRLVQLRPVAEAAAHQARRNRRAGRGAVTPPSRGDRRVAERSRGGRCLGVRRWVVSSLHPGTRLRRHAINAESIHSYISTSETCLRPRPKLGPYTSARSARSAGSPGRPRPQPHPRP